MYSRVGRDPCKDGISHQTFGPSKTPGGLWETGP